MASPSMILWKAAGSPVYPETHKGVCRVCQQDTAGIAFVNWAKPGFMDHDKLAPGTILCPACQMIFDDAHEGLTRRTAWWPTPEEALAANAPRVAEWQKIHKTTTTPDPAAINLRQQWEGWCIPQKMRNYSHFIDYAGEWHPLSKGQKPAMLALLLASHPPQVVAIATSGQKHVLFRVRPLWWQVEETAVLPAPVPLQLLVTTMGRLLTVFSKAELETGEYRQDRIARYGFSATRRDTAIVLPQRGSALFTLALFLAQKDLTYGIAIAGDCVDSRRADGIDPTCMPLESHPTPVQGVLPEDDLGSIRTTRPRRRSQHRQSDTSGQLGLFNL